MIATWKRRYLAAIAICAICMALAAQETSGTITTSSADSGSTRGRDRNTERRFRGSDNNPEERIDHHRTNPEEFRQMMKAELEHLPRLNKRMQRLMEIQAERYTLQSERRMVATEQGPDRAAIVKKFHELLRRDMQLSEESRKIVQQIIKDMPIIQKEMSERRSDIKETIDRENKLSADGATSSTSARDLRRSQRYLDFLDQKLKDLETRPERLDLLSRMLRGIPFDDGPPPGNPREVPLKPEEQLNELKQKRRHLQRQLRQVEDNIDQLHKQGVKDGPNDDSTSTSVDDMATSR